jgi:HlyD family secretion protein
MAACVNRRLIRDIRKPPGTRSKPVNRKAPVVAALAVVAIVAGVSYWWRISGEPPDQESELVLYGNVDIREVRLAFNGSEHVTEILVEEGDRVEAGQLVARLHTERLIAARDRVRAELAAVEAGAHAAMLTDQRIRKLANNKLASREEADEAQANRRVATARVAAAKAALAEAEQALSDAELYAPVGGVVRDRIVEPGDFVTPQTPVLLLALTDRVWVRTYLPEPYLGQVPPGTRATITTDSFPGKTYEGWVGFISPTAEFTPKNVETPELRTRLVYQARVFACNPQLELRLGMPATVSIPLGQTGTPPAQPENRCAPSGSASQ